MADWKADFRGAAVVVEVEVVVAEIGEVVGALMVGDVRLRAEGSGGIEARMRER
jgi:hypothetical protein